MVLEHTLTVKIITYGYEPPVTDTSKPKKQIYQQCSATPSTPTFCSGNRNHRFLWNSGLNKNSGTA